MQPGFQINIPSTKLVSKSIYQFDGIFQIRIFQIWSTPVDYEELAMGFEPIRNGEIFWMYNNV